jgi:hypothetical protein
LLDLQQQKHVMMEMQLTAMDVAIHVLLNLDLAVHESQVYVMYVVTVLFNEEKPVMMGIQLMVMVVTVCVR